MFDRVGPPAGVVQWIRTWRPPVPVEPCRPVPDLSPRPEWGAIRWQGSVQWSKEFLDLKKSHRTVPTASQWIFQPLERRREFHLGASEDRHSMSPPRQKVPEKVQEVHLFVCRRERQTEKPQDSPAQVLSPWHRDQKTSWGFQSLDLR